MSNHTCIEPTTFQFYQAYHTHPVNKFFHLMGIPSIILSLMVFLKDFYVIYNGYGPIMTKPLIAFWGLSLKNIVSGLYCIYYYKFGFFPGVVMHIYFTLLNIIAEKGNISYRFASYLFIVSWFLQFTGHFIEGNRPALMDSIGQAFLGAPIFSLIPIVPRLKNYL
tara:strand:- start:99 stop:593 length:495 start_codon:yes stop_codon:yes gene_type:complete